jgi:hypothetical protein
MSGQGNDANAQSGATNAPPPARASGPNVTVTKGVDGYLISIPREDGSPREIILSRDGSAITKVDGVSTTAIVRRRNDIPDHVMEVIYNGMTLIGVIAILGPLVRAAVRRFERQPAKLSDAAVQRLAGIEQAVEAVAVEVERISEGQRFTTKLLAEREKEIELR